MTKITPTPPSGHNPNPGYATNAAVHREVPSHRSRSIQFPALFSPLSAIQPIHECNVAVLPALPGRLDAHASRSPRSWIRMKVRSRR